jgi:ATP-binding cassette subfamily F protein 3
MSLVSLVGVDKSYGTWPVLQGVDLVVPDGARIGIVGPNGAGKSTLLRILGGAEDVNGGEVVRRRGVTASFLEQHPGGDDRSAEAWVVAARPDVAALDGELRGIEAELARPDLAGDLAKMDRVLTRQRAVLDRWVDAGGAGLAGEARTLLVRLGFDEHDLTLPTTALSGGQRKLAALAACLVRDPDLLLLDEPETHLDADRRELLEDVVAGFPGAVVTVSHDRYLPRTRWRRSSRWSVSSSGG